MLSDIETNRISTGKIQNTLIAKLPSADCLIEMAEVLTFLLTHWRTGNRPGIVAGPVFIYSYFVAKHSGFMPNL